MVKAPISTVAVSRAQRVPTTVTPVAMDMDDIRTAQAVRYEATIAMCAMSWYDVAKYTHVVMDRPDDTPRSVYVYQAVWSARRYGARDTTQDTYYSASRSINR